MPFNPKNGDLQFFSSLIIAYLHIFYIKLLILSMQRQLYSYKYEIGPV
jgi:hypothetical protein